MAKLTTVFLFCAIFAFSECSVGNIVEEAKKQLKELEDIVRGNILSAHDELGNIISVWGAKANSIYNEGTVALEQEHDTIIAQVQALKDIAHGAGVDPSSCTDVREAVLNRLPLRYAGEIGECIGDIITEGQRVVKDGNYIIDVTINKVHQLEQQLNRCGDSVLCISPIVTEIELNKIRIPQNIKTEVQAIEVTLNSLELSVQECADDKVAQYSTEATGIFTDISACINRLLDQ